MNINNILASLLALLSLVFITQHSYAAPKSDLWPYWQTYDATSKRQVDHRQWQIFLDTYLVVGQPADVHRVNYSAVTPADKKHLNHYIFGLTQNDPTTLNRDQQFAYWVNLYNAATVYLVLENYPIRSIKTLGKGWFSFGPWDDEILKINGKSLSLNDIEHRILRPIWQDPRIHFVVNCASLGCPNLPASTIDPLTYQTQLADAAKAYINHPRGIKIENNQLRLSSLFKWYQDDFGANTQEVIQTLLVYANIKNRKALEAVNLDGISYEYDWALNDLTKPKP